MSVIATPEQAVPDAAPNNITEAIRQAHAIEDRAYELTEPCWSGGAMLPAREFKQLSRDAAAVLAGDFPFLPKKTISRLVSQAHYFHSK